MAEKEKSAAVLTIKSPGTMTPEGRQSIAGWLRRLADDLVDLGDQYGDRRFRARYLYTESE